MCKSKGGRTKHIRSKHVEASNVEGINVGAKTKPIPSHVTEEKVLSLIREIAKSLKDEKIYPGKQVDAVFTLRPSEAFVQDINALLHKFHCKKDRDKFMQEYYGKMYALWREYFQPCEDHKVAFLILINLPERLMILNKDGSEVSRVTSEDGVWQQFIYTCSVIFLMTGRDSIDFYASLRLRQFLVLRRLRTIQ